MKRISKILLARRGKHWRRSVLPKWLAGFAALVVFSATAPCVAADRVVLRDLTIIRDTTVKQMSVDGLQLADGRVFTWDQIESAKLENGQQQLFDKYLANLGDHLYRLRRRMNTGDYAGLVDHAAAIEKYYRQRTSDTAFQVQVGLMWGRLAVGQREAAVAPYLRALEIIRRREGNAPPLPGNRTLTYDATTGMTSELAPVWFNKQAAKAAMPKLLAVAAEMKNPRPAAARVYYASLAIAAGEDAAAARVVSGIGTEEIAVAQLRQILLAQQEIATGEHGEALQTLETQADHYNPTTRPIALYWIGHARLGSEQSEVRKQGMLTLLQLPASYGESYPTLAAAALHQVMVALETAGDSRGSLALRGELLAKYGQTYHAVHVDDRVIKETKE